MLRGIMGHVIRQLESLTGPNVYTVFLKIRQREHRVAINLSREMCKVRGVYIKLEVSSD